MSRAVHAFDWKKLTPASELAHRVDDAGRLLLRGDDATTAPFETARVRDGRGGFVTRSVASLGFTWTRAESDDGWTLRTAGTPTTMTSVAGFWGHMVRDACAPLGLDAQLVLMTIACEAGAVRPDRKGLVKAPRTENGYPQRAGERDPGDFARDAKDWRASRGAHSSHGLLQTLIATATAARPDLFKDTSPSKYRTVLWSPANSIACGVAHIAGFPDRVLRDPLALRVHYASGSVRAPATTPNRWGAVLYDELVAMYGVAFWNDAAALAAHAPAPTHARDETVARAPDHSIAWAFATLSLFALSIAAAWGASHFTTRAATPRRTALAS
jgi:hypothetical protein